jgi:hypothetical protein
LVSWVVTEERFQLFPESLGRHRPHGSNNHPSDVNYSGAAVGSRVGAVVFRKTHLLPSLSVDGPSPFANSSLRCYAGVEVTDGLDTRRTDLLLQFTLLTAAQADEWRDREIGPIHLLKYAYLADLAFGERHGGTSYTGARWQFYHFGPWQAEIHNRIEPALAAIGAAVKQIPSRYESDFIRYSIPTDSIDETRGDAIRGELPLSIVGTIECAFREHGSDTASLLRAAYLTRPMLKAAPGELLDLTPEPVSETVRVEPTPQLSKRQQRARAEGLQALKAKVRERLSQRTPQRATAPAPRYDEIFAAGTNWLDSLAGEPVRPQQGELLMDESIWKSSHRSEPDVP